MDEVVTPWERQVAERALTKVLGGTSWFIATPHLLTHHLLVIKKMCSVLDQSSKKLHFRIQVDVLFSNRTTRQSMWIFLKYFLCADFIWNHHEYFLCFVFQGVSSNSSWEQAMKLIINDPRYRYNAFQRSVYPSYNSKFKLSPSLTYNLLLFLSTKCTSEAERKEAGVQCIQSPDREGRKGGGQN